MISYPYHSDEEVTQQDEKHSEVRSVKRAELYAEANRLFAEEQRLAKLDDPTVPEGTVTYKHAVMYYTKKDGTKSRYEYSYPYVRIDGEQRYVRRNAREIVEILETRKQLKEIRRRLKAVLKEIGAKEPVSRCPKEERLREKCGMEMERIEQNRRKKKKEEIKYITRRGDEVKSRGECVVGNELEWAGFLYEYEPYFYMEKGYRKPDFQAYGMQGYFYVEVLGVGDDPIYRKKNAAKLKEYRKHGIKVGKNLVVFENRGKGIDSRKIKEVLIEAAGGKLPKRVVYI